MNPRHPIVSCLLLTTPAMAQVTWTQQPGTAAPRQHHAMVYDSARQVVVMFGGRHLSGDLGDTWEWDGNNWQLMSTPVQPAARSRHAMAYDAAREVVLMFGGAGPAQDGTWEWDGTTWTERLPATSPTGRDSAVTASR